MKTHIKNAKIFSCKATKQLNMLIGNSKGTKMK